MLYLTPQFYIDEKICCGDKSISHRALILAALSDGKCVLRNVSLCRDVLATAQCLRQLGASVDFCGTTATVLPISCLPQGNIVLNCENSGTTARLLAGLTAGLGVDATFVGDESLSKRPMDRILKPLSQMGARFQTGDGFLFRNIPQKLRGANIVADVPSAQVKSGVLLAALFAEGETLYTEKVPTRNHTEILLRQLGADICFSTDAICVRKSAISSFQTDIPNDISSFAFLIALSILTGEKRIFRNICVNSGRAGFLRVLQKSGANVFFAQSPRGFR